MIWFFCPWVVSFKNNFLFFFLHEVFTVQLKLLSDETLKKHYIWQHLVNEDDCCFKDLFTPDTNIKSCDICTLDFKNSRTRKNHVFLLHYNQMGGNRRNEQLPINILQRGPLKYFSLDYNQQNKFYDFFE